MESPDRNNDIVAFLIRNMEEMEIELRAHSMVLEAVSASIITAPEIRGGLELARSSTAMREFVRSKYAELHNPLYPRTFKPTTNDMADFLQLTAFTGHVN